MVVRLLGLAEVWYSFCDPSYWSSREHSPSCSVSTISRFALALT
jgi:hypothetical protein